MRSCVLQTPARAWVLLQKLSPWSYIGSASFGDCPLIQGQLLQLDATTGKLIHQFDTIPTGCTGGGIWSTPTIDEATNRLYVTTGNPPPKCTGANIYAPALIELGPSDVSHLLDYWQVPREQQNGDSDFGTTLTLFQETINGVSTNMVGAANKDGIYYAFDRSNIGAGPVWEVRIAVNGECPQCGGGSVSSSAWDGHTLYMAGGKTTINGEACRGSVRALNPNTITFSNANTSVTPTPTAPIRFPGQSAGRCLPMQQFFLREGGEPAYPILLSTLPNHGLSYAQATLLSISFITTSV